MGNKTESYGALNAPILIIEDHQDLGAALEDFLADEGFAVTRVLNPTEAEFLLRTSCFSLVLTDYPFETSRQLALDLLKIAADVPVGCVTAWHAVPAEIEARYAFKLSVPFDLTMLLAMVARYAAVQVAEPSKAGVIERYFDALGRRNWADLVALCTESIRYHLPGTDDLSRTLTGREALRAHAAEAFASFPDARFEILSISWLPRGAIAGYRAFWNPTGDEVGSASGAVYFQFQGDEIATIGVRTDVAKFRHAVRQAGERPTPALIG